MNRNRSDDTKGAPIIHKDVQLQPYNSLNVKAVAEKFTVIRKCSELSDLYRGGFLNGKVWVLGGGSNVLFTGKVQALVIKNEIESLQVVEESDRKVVIQCGGGNNWHRLVRYCVEKGWGGIENLALIPGSVGAAPIQNIGAYGVELKDCFVSLEAFDLQTGKRETFYQKDCEFSYRNSIFKRGQKNRYFITSVSLRLSKFPHQIRSEYDSLSSWLDERGIENPSIEDIYNGVVEIRTGKLPDPKDLANAGSFFKNPVISESLLNKLKEKYPDIPSYPQKNDKVKVPAGWLIEKTGWKGKKVGNVGTYENQALVIVNHGGASGAEIKELAGRIRDSVDKEFGIELVPEVNIIGSE